MPADPAPRTTDWLYHHVTVTGPEPALTAFRDAAAGDGAVPWRLDLDRMEEDWFHRLVMAPERTLSAAGARILAGQLRDAVSRRQHLALAGGAASCPFDLHALVPVPSMLLQHGPDDPASLAWLWAHWGTTQAFRHVARTNPAPGMLRYTFWSADWTPWPVIASAAVRFPALRIEARPHYDPP